MRKSCQAANLDAIYEDQSGDSAMVRSKVDTPSLIKTPQFGMKDSLQAPLAKKPCSSSSRCFARNLSCPKKLMHETNVCPKTAKTAERAT